MVLLDAQRKANDKYKQNNYKKDVFHSKFKGGMNYDSIKTECNNGT